MMVETEQYVPAPALRRPTGSQTKLFIGALVVLLAIGYLAFAAARGSGAYYLTVGELKAQGPSSRHVRVTGTVQGESISWQPRELLLEFQIADESGSLRASYKGPRPDMLRDGATAVLEGQYTSEGVFKANKIMLKCPSKYEEAK